MGYEDERYFGGSRDADPLQIFESDRLAVRGDAGVNYDPAVVAEVGNHTFAETRAKNIDFDLSGLGCFQSIPVTKSSQKRPRAFDRKTKVLLSPSGQSSENYL